MIGLISVSLVKIDILERKSPAAAVWISAFAAYRKPHALPGLV